MQISEALKVGKSVLKNHSSSYGLDTELLLAYALNASKEYLMIHDDKSLSFFQYFYYRYLIHKRKKGVPIAYLTREKGFRSLNLYVDSRVLVPRPDTEILVEVALKYLKENSSVKYLIDVGTGSGCIPLSLLNESTDLRAIAIDRSSGALKVAKINAKKNHLIRRITFLKNDLLSQFSFKGHLGNKNYILTANLPYLPADYAKSNPNLCHEPSIALYAEDQGVDLYLKLIGQLKNFPPKALFFECFDWQVPMLKGYLKNYRIDIKKMTGQAVLLAGYLN